MEKLLNEVSKMNESDLRKLNSFVVSRLKNIVSEKNERAKLKFEVGDEISFFSKKHGNVFGKIEKINRTTANVISSNMKWRVHMSLLKKV